MPRPLPPWWPTVWTALIALAAALVMATWPGGSRAQPAEPALSLAEQSQALDRARRAVLAVQTQAVAGARSARALGERREGSGVLIREDGLVLTIGYLVLESEAAMLLTDDGREVPARVVAHDAATGLGLLQSLAPLGIPPAPLAPGGAGRLDQAYTMVSGGPQGEVSPVVLHGRPPFSGYWEYHLEQALVTTPARTDHNGAGLFDARGRLVGIGALFARDAVALVPDGAQAAGQPANLFVPAELLPPILDELLADGRGHASRRAWLGLNCVQLDDGDVRVMRTTEDGPAAQAGLQPGDRILRIDGRPVTALAGLWQALWAGGPPERPVRLDIQREGQQSSLTVQAIDRDATLKRPRGI